MHVVLAGLDRLPDDQHPRLHVVADGSRPAALADVVQPLLDDRPVLVLHPAWDTDTRRTVDSLHMALDTPSFLRCSTGLAPLAASAVGGLLAALTDHVAEPAVLMAGLPRLVNRVLAAGLLGSVTHLEHLSASLGQHVSSWLPGARFLAVSGPDTRVERLSRRAAVPLPPVVEDRRALLAVGNNALRGPIIEALTARGTATPRIDEVPLTERSKAWWGTDELVEIAIVPARIERLAADLVEHAGTPAPCGWCERLTPISPCPWCGHAAATVATP